MKKVKAVSNTVWVCESYGLREYISKRNELMKTILTIVTITLLLCYLIDLPGIHSVKI